MPKETDFSNLHETNKGRVLALGVFDLFHVGHLRYLQYARSVASHLTVAVTTDEISRAIKGKLPVIPESQRLEIIRGLGWVDDARLQPVSTEFTYEATLWVTAWNINHFVVGGDWEGSPRWDRLKPSLAEHSISVSFVPYTQDISTTKIINNINGR